MISVLVVDDSMILRRNISKMLTDMGMKVVAEAKDGMDAVKACVRFTPELVTMDITMTDMDGITAVKEIRKQNIPSKIIMVTSHGQEEMVMEAIKAGASGYVLKPVTIEKLEKALIRVFPDFVKNSSAHSEKEEGDETILQEYDDLKLDDN